MLTKMYVERIVEHGPGYSRPETIAEWDNVADIPRKGDILQLNASGVPHQTVTRVVWEESPIADGFHIVNIYTRDSTSDDY